MGKVGRRGWVKEERERGESVQGQEVSSFPCTAGLEDEGGRRWKHGLGPDNRGPVHHAEGLLFIL